MMMLILCSLLCHFLIPSCSVNHNSLNLNLKLVDVVGLKVALKLVTKMEFLYCIYVFMIRVMGF
jgi:hypothetical protein